MRTEPKIPAHLQLYVDTLGERFERCAARDRYGYHDMTEYIEHILSMVGEKSRDRIAYAINWKRRMMPYVHRLIVRQESSIPASFYMAETDAYSAQCAESQIRSDRDRLVVAMRSARMTDSAFRQKEASFRPLIDEIESDDDRFPAIAESDDSSVTFAPHDTIAFLPRTRQTLKLNRYISRFYRDTIKAMQQSIDDAFRNGTLDQSLFRRTSSRRDDAQANTLKPVSAESLVERFCAAVLTAIRDIDRYFTILRGNDVMDAYRDEVGGRSCMSGDSCGYTELYAENPEHIGLLVYRPQGTNENSARALLWTTDQGNTLIDRIYTRGSYSVAEAAYVRWADSHNAGFTNNREYRDDTVTLRKTDYAPYMDSFTSAADTGIGKVKLYLDGRGDLELQSTDGTWYKNIPCALCGDTSSHQDDMCYIEWQGYICETCYCENYFSCNHCGDVGHQDDSRYVEDNGDYCESCYDRYFVDCYHCGECTSRDDATTDNDGDAFCDSCYSDRYTSCDRCDDELSHDDAIGVDSGRLSETLCDSCADIHYPECGNCDTRVPGDELIILVGRRIGSCCGDCADEFTDTVIVPTTVV